MKSLHRRESPKSITPRFLAKTKWARSVSGLTLLLGLTVAQSTWANDTYARFTATIDGIVGQENVTISPTKKEVTGEIQFQQSSQLEPGFYDGHTWLNAVKQISFGEPINATFTGMGVALYPDQQFISVLYSADKCPSTGIACSASGTSTFSLPDGTEKELSALSYHFHQPDSENTPPQLAAVIERFISHASKGTTKALVRYRGENSLEPVLTLTMTINSVEEIKTKN